MLSLNDRIVLTVCLYNHADNENISEETKSIFDEMHRAKIDMSDAIYIVNQDGYIGQSTSNEIAYAFINNKRIYFREYSDESLGRIYAIKSIIQKSGEHIESFHNMCSDTEFDPAKEFNSYIKGNFGFAPNFDYTMMRTTIAMLAGRNCIPEELQDNWYLYG